MSDEAVTPALTAEEWGDSSGSWIKRDAFELEWGNDGALDMYGPGFGFAFGPEDSGDLHALAALALHGQPFGFTRGDVELVRDCIGMEWDRGTRDQCDQMERRLESLAARIAALLPPEAS